MSLSGDEDERILAAADGLSRRQDGSFTMAELARSAGVSRATLYRRVGGRARVVAALREQGATPRAPRDRLLAATLELIGERGPLGFSLEDVAARAGASVTTIYRTFRERDELIRAAVATLASPAALRASLAELDAPLRPTLEVFVAGALARFEAQPALVRILFTPDEAGWHYLQRLRARESKLSLAAIAYFEAQLARGRVRGGSGRQLAMALVGLVIGDMLAHRFVEAGARADRAVRARDLVALFLGGVARGRRA